MSPTSDITSRAARVGDWVQTRGIHGGSARAGEIIEILGRSGHEHFRVRWDEAHESILFPSDGVTIVPRPREPRES